MKIKVLGYFYRLQTKFGARYCFIRVCHSVHRCGWGWGWGGDEVGFPTCTTGHFTSIGGFGFPACITGHMTGGLHPGGEGSASRRGWGVWIQEGGGSTSRGRGSAYIGGWTDPLAELEKQVVHIIPCFLVNDYFLSQYGIVFISDGSRIFRRPKVGQQPIILAKYSEKLDENENNPSIHQCLM